MSGSWIRIPASLHRIRQPPDNVANGLESISSLKPRPVRILRACFSTSTTFIWSFQSVTGLQWLGGASRPDSCKCH